MFLAVVLLATGAVTWNQVLAADVAADAQVEAKTECPEGCTKDCCKDKEKCAAGCTKACCKDKKTCEAGCQKECCKDKTADKSETLAIGIVMMAPLASAKVVAKAEVAEVAVAAPQDFTATHNQVALLKVLPDGVAAGESDEDAIARKEKNPSWGVKSFCLDSNDNLLVAVGDLKAGQLQLLDPTGKRFKSWDLSVVPEAVNIHPDGSFLVAGGGKIFKLNTEGEVILEVASPLVAQVEANKDQFRQELIDQMTSQSKMMLQQVERYDAELVKIVDRAARRLDRDEHKEYRLLKERLAAHEAAKTKAAEAKADEAAAGDENAWALRKVLFNMLTTKVEASLNDRELQMRKIYTEQGQRMREYAAQQGGGEPTEEQIDAALVTQIAYKSRIASISAVGDDVFIATGAIKGYGYDVWKFDVKFENPEKLASGLRGCCGQMDVQACESGLYVAENSGHQVQHLDFTGKKINSWGKGAREGVRGFGSCCNPMNVAFGPDGTVYTAESGTGRIKRYSAEGELIQLVGSVELVPGCKKVSIAVTKDHQRVYMLDITRNHIIVMEEKSDEAKVASKVTEKKAS